MSRRNAAEIRTGLGIVTIRKIGDRRYEWHSPTGEPGEAETMARAAYLAGANDRQRWIKSQLVTMLGRF